MLNHCRRKTHSSLHPILGSLFSTTAHFDRIFSTVVFLRFRNSDFEFAASPRQDIPCKNIACSHCPQFSSQFFPASSRQLRTRTKTGNSSGTTNSMAQRLPHLRIRMGRRRRTLVYRWQALADSDQMGLKRRKISRTIRSAVLHGAEPCHRRRLCGKRGRFDEVSA